MIYFSTVLPVVMDITVNLPDETRVILKVRRTFVKFMEIALLKMCEHIFRLLSWQ